MDLQFLYGIYKQSTGVCTDTRRLQPGQVYFALKGDQFDGNAFVQAALGAGALAAVADDPGLAGSDKVIIVDNALESLQQLARHHRLQMPARVIGITGSNGKTTSKELVSAVLSTQYKVLHTTGNLNNHIGVPLTLLQLTDAHHFAVVEMGANHSGEIARLCDIAQPKYGVITNVGKAHMEGFGGIEGVIQAKKELYDFIAVHTGTIFINPTLPHLERMAAGVADRIVYGTEPGVRGRVTGDIPGLRMEVSWEGGEMTLQTRITGQYNLNNILLAMAVGLHFGVPVDSIKSAVEGYTPSNNRSQVIQRPGLTVILDAYNANPSSMEEALRNLAIFRGTQRIAILGDMLELGTYAPVEHKHIAALAAECADRVILVGEAFGAIDRTAMHFPDAEACKRWFDTQDFHDAMILIKGSRKLQLERIVADWVTR